ncbi:MAG: hypothetical protein KF838_11485 [Phycisphaeraceae bacterium]|nr:MAG: hypothetical protein KF838_11485 [Phycisphaeraceae bacterium]
MDIPRWSDMDQKQRILSIGGGVLLLIAIVLIARGLFGGGAAEPVDPANAQGIQSAVNDGTIKVPPPNPENEETGEPGGGKRPAGG